MRRKIGKMGKTPAMPRCVVCDKIGVHHIDKNVWLCGSQACRVAWADANDPTFRMPRVKRA